MVAAGAVIVTAAALGADANRLGEKPAAPKKSTADLSAFLPDAPSVDDRLADRETVKRAAETLRKSEDAGVREEAARTLAASGHDATIRPLTSALADPDGQVREKAAMGLALISNPEVITPLLEALGDPDAQVREKAAIGLAFRRDPRIIDPLVAALGDPDSQVREKAAIALGTSGDSRAHRALTAATEDPDPQVREKAVAGLTLLANAGTPEQGETLRAGLRSLTGALLRLAQ